MKKFIVLALFSVLVLSACSSGSSAVTNLGAAEFIQSSQPADVVIIDVRSPEEFATGHLENALNFNVESFEFDAQIATLDKSKTYALYCRSGRRSAVAAAKMADAGFTTIVNATAGFDKLAQSGAKTA